METGRRSKSDLYIGLKNEFVWVEDELELCPGVKRDLAQSARHGKPNRTARKECDLVPVFPPGPPHAKMEKNFEKSRGERQREGDFS